ncbi:MAG: M48 family metallopeptidase [Patescibacteria group bacterium]|jgi:heat shock protein HtpX|nr:M48 family metallopeptidase [Patescibacteria group bacterium]
MYSQIDNNKRKSFIFTIIFVFFIIFLGWIFTRLSNTGYTGLIVAIIIALIMSLSGYYSGDKVALWTAGAKEIKKEHNPYVFNLVENLCITAGIPVPKIHIIDDPVPNAFATGRDPKHASIALTTGLIKNLENEELEGVIAHELSHIKNYDIRLMTLVVVLVGIVSILSQWFFRIGSLGNRSRDNKAGSISIIFFLLGLALIILSPLVAQLIKLAISRKREYLADASGALLTRYPEGLARALEKISQYNQPLKRANGAIAHLYIASPFGQVKNFTANLFSTHPPIEKRISALRKI